MNLPSSWYYVSSSRSIKRKKLHSFEIAQYSIVLYRNSRNLIIALESRCSHLGTNLSNGFIEKDELVCPLHHWHFDEDGNCIKNSCKNKNIQFKQTKFPTQEAFGSIFVFLGDDFFQFPMVPNFENFIFKSLPKVNLETDWFTVGANGYDTLHLSIVHKRGLKEEPILTFPEKHIFIMETKAFVEGKNISDRIIKFISKDSITAKISSFGGVFIVLESNLHTRQTLLLVFLQPNKDNVNIIAIAGIRRSIFFVDFFKKYISAYFFKKFLFKDIKPLSKMKLRIENMKLDPVLKNYHKYLQNLKQI
ncbi:Rieske 2Fe-2S domain-containing protein [Leptospira sp. GIMC2001]|uniref:Rieske 2Fe-2S domain-containing protein n=1 Tax=Leptospira sp. GIMC2001 TaxID=1513297 RepID=UPI00234AFBA5|nr:Rieske 2Fe-2S domain-containing protein [Leptospira sp. GIMC2001]WCL49173.1 Rieske 2Fe-2S domain-containing protein [Leptospira sp. GIMC2001]